MKSVITLLLMMVQARFGKFLTFWFIVTFLNTWGMLKGGTPDIRLGPWGSWLLMFIVSLLSFLYGLNMRLEDICERGFDDGDKKLS